MNTFQDKLEAAGSATELLRANEVRPGFTTPYPAEYSNWRDEQRGWTQTATIFDQSFHMLDLYIKGPDVKRLLSDTSPNSYANYGAGKAKQYMAVNEQGAVIGDSILFGLSEDESVLVGIDPAANWLQYQAEKGNYDVEFTREKQGFDGPVPKRLYRYNIEGPNAWKILTKAAGAQLDHIGFFAIGELRIAGRTVGALNHTMGGIPGDDLTGLELYGPSEDGEAVLEAILAAGEEFGLVRGGALAYISTALESGWLGLPAPAIFGDDLRAYREWLPADTFEGFFPIRGSFHSSEISDYYMDPWQLGYGHMVKFDHDFIGRDALEKLAENPAGQKVWLKWNDDDAARVIASSFIGVGNDQAKLMRLPSNGQVFDQVLVDGERVGIARMHGHTVNLGGITAVGPVDLDHAVDGQAVEIVWGEYDGGASMKILPEHKQVNVRATVSTKSPVA